MDGWKEYIGKRVYVELKNGRRYQGNVIDYENHFLKIIDKFGARISLSIEDISLVQEERR